MESFGDANLKKISEPGVRIASGVATGAARHGCHHFGVTTFYDTNLNKKENNSMLNNIGNVQQTETD